MRLLLDLFCNWSIGRSDDDQEEQISISEWAEPCWLCDHFIRLWRRMVRRLFHIRQIKRRAWHWGLVSLYSLRWNLQVNKATNAFDPLFKSKYSCMWLLNFTVQTFLPWFFYFWCWIANNIHLQNRIIFFKGTTRHILQLLQQDMLQFRITTKQLCNLQWQMLDRSLLPSTPARMHFSFTAAVKRSYLHILCS